MYLQVKSDLRPSENDSVLVNVSVAATVLGNNTLKCDPTTLAHKRTLHVNASTPNHWQEWDVTSNLQNCWNITKGDELLEMEINFTLPDCERNKRVPIRVVDPATVRLHQEKRRSKYELVQPMVVVYVVDEKERDSSKWSTNGLKIEDISDTVETRNSTDDDSDSSGHFVSKRRAVIKHCKLENFTINFAQISLHRVLAPHSYNARHCVGSCNPHVIERVRNSTNHARLFASTYAKYQTQPSQFLSPPHNPCCVPVEYSHMHLIELRKDGSLSYMKYPNMVATKCGCR